MNTPWINTAAAAAYSGLSVSVLTKLARANRIRHGSDGRHYKWRTEFIDAYFLAKGFDGRRKS